MKNHLMFHGTTLKNAKAISVEGFKENRNTIWTDSVLDNTYFFKETIEDEFDGFIHACGNAQITSAATGSLDYLCGIIVLTVPDEYLCCFSNDSSGITGFGMEDLAWEIDTDSLNELIKTGKIRMNVIYADIYNPAFRTMYTDLSAENINVYARTEQEEELIKEASRNNSRCFMDEFLDVNYEAFAKVRHLLLEICGNSKSA